VQNNKNIHLTFIASIQIIILFYPLSGLALKDDRTKPITITAGRAERDEKLGLTIYQGNVVIRQGSILIEAETVTIKTRISPVTSREELEEIIATGNPSHLQQQLELNGELVDAISTTIRYDIDSDAVSLIENAVLKQGERVVTGDRIIYDIAAQKIIAGGEKTAENPGDRVTVTIPPKSTTPK